VVATREIHFGQSARLAIPAPVHFLSFRLHAVDHRLRLMVAPDELLIFLASRLARGGFHRNDDDNRDNDEKNKGHGEYPFLVLALEFVSEAAVLLMSRVDPLA
jgi:hypothetical protein